MPAGLSLSDVWNLIEWSWSKVELSEEEKHKRKEQLAALRATIATFKAAGSVRQL